MSMLNYEHVHLTECTAMPQAVSTHPLLQSAENPGPAYDRQPTYPSMARAEQLQVAKQQPPHLKAIFPFDSRGAYGEFGGFRDEYPGGVIHLFRYLVGHFSAMHQNRGAPGPLPPEREKLWREAMNNPDYK